MDVARLNFSHGSHDEHKQTIATIRHVSEEMNKPVAILQDLQGPKIRIGTFAEGPVSLSEGQKFTLTTRQVEGTSEIVTVSYPEFAEDVKEGDTILLDDGLLNLTVDKVNDTDVTCTVKFGGILSDHKGLNLPGNLLSVDALTPKDLEDLEFGLAQDVAVRLRQHPPEDRAAGGGEAVLRAAEVEDVVAGCEIGDAVGIGQDDVQVAGLAGIPGAGRDPDADAGEVVG